jgi:hypothetical protein
METTKNPRLTTSQETPVDHAPSENRKVDSALGVLFKSVFWFVLLPLLAILILKWLF